MQSLQQQINEKVLQQINRGRMYNLSELNITFTSTPKTNTSIQLNDLKISTKQQQGQFSIPLTKQGSDKQLIRKNVSLYHELHQKQLQSEMSQGILRDQGIQQTIINNLEKQRIPLAYRPKVSSVELHKFRDKSTMLSLYQSEANKEIRKQWGQEVIQRRKEYDNMVRQNYLPKLKKVSRNLSIHSYIREGSQQTMQDELHRRYDPNNYDYELQQWMSRFNASYQEPQ